MNSLRGEGLFRFQGIIKSLEWGVPNVKEESGDET